MPMTRSARRSLGTWPCMWCRWCRWSGIESGVICPGSGTDVLLQFLRRSPQRWSFHHELVMTLGRSKSEIDWALLYLVQQSLVASRLTDLPSRKPVLHHQLVRSGG